MPDSILKGMEINSICLYLGDGAKVLDIGCGNGYSTIEFARRFPKMHLLGIDYSEKMIEIANEMLKAESKEVQKRIRFEVRDILNLRLPKESFDIVTTDRCLINLPTKEAQQQALQNIYTLLKAGSVYVMCEDTQQGLARINELRKITGLSEIATRWHNLYIDENWFFSVSRRYFSLVETNNFSSLYYIASRVFNAKLAASEGKQPDYHHPINQIAARLPSIGDYGPLKIFVLKKR